MTACTQSTSVTMAMGTYPSHRVQRTSFVSFTLAVLPRYKSSRLTLRQAQIARSAESLREDFVYMGMPANQQFWFFGCFCLKPNVYSATEHLVTKRGDIDDLCSKAPTQIIHHAHIKR